MVPSKLAFRLIYLLSSLTSYAMLEILDEIDTSSGIVEFDPYVSSLDAYSRSRYGISEIIPFASLVASRFKTVYINLNHNNTLPGDQTSLSLSAVAIAKYNCLNTTIQKLEILLGINGWSYPQQQKASCNCKYFKDLKFHTQLYANKINAICSGTVRSIWMNHFFEIPCKTSMNECQSSQNMSDSVKAVDHKNYNWGSIFLFHYFCNTAINLHKHYNSTSVILIYSKEDNLHKDLTTCKHYSNNSIGLLGIIKHYILSDTNVKSNNKMDMSNFVKVWKTSLQKSGYRYILSKAFDVYDFYTWQRTPLLPTNGWWYLVNDQGKLNTKEFVFNEKIQLAKKIDHDESPSNYEWLHQENNFNKTSVGFILTGPVREDKLTNISCKFLVQAWSSLSAALYLLNLTTFDANATSCGSRFEIHIMIDKMTSMDLNDLLDYKKQNLILIQSINFNMSHISYDNTLYNESKNLGFKIGYSYSLDLCGIHSQLDDMSKMVLIKTLQDSKSKLHLFHFEETRDTIMLGATRMFLRRKLVFEECIKMVNNYGENFTRIGFAMVRYPKDDKFYSFPWHIQNYVKYVDLLSKWAGNKTKTLFFVGPDRDSDIKYVKNDNIVQSVGWYWFDLSQGIYISKRQEALKLSMVHYPELKDVTISSLSNAQIILAVGLPVSLLLLVVAFTVYIMWSYKQRNNMLKEEIDMFLNGQKSTNLLNDNEFLKKPYHKIKYEIQDDKFKIDESIMLGSGEFGIVYRGSIYSENDEISVAVKIINRLKSQRTVLSSILSEIKVLSYLGKHRNIVELIGVNTTGLKQGNVFVFLELCHLGSLEKFLREIRSLNISCDVSKGKHFQNTILETSLDTFVLEDLYHWSTEICSGMKYLADMHVVHADLATRNVLLNFKKEAKICDFGLSRRMYNYTNYVKTGQEPLPWKWMAPESLNCNEFSEKSDVWAFGITLWEIYSLGVSPYPGLAWDTCFTKKLEDGLRLPEPKYNIMNMYDLMQKCWSFIPSERPSFSQIYSTLKITNGGMDYYTTVL